MSMLFECTDLVLSEKGSEGFKKSIYIGLNLSVPFSQDDRLFIEQRDSVNNYALAKLLAGTLEAESGKGGVFLNGTTVTKPVIIGRETRAVSWLSVKENINSIASAHGITGSAANAIAEKVIKVVGLEGYEQHVPRVESTGFQLRLLLAMGLAAGTELFIIDSYLQNIPTEFLPEIMDVFADIQKEFRVGYLVLGLADRAIEEYFPVKVIL